MASKRGCRRAILFAIHAYQVLLDRRATFAHRYDASTLLVNGFHVLAAFVLLGSLNWSARGLAGNDKIVVFNGGEIVADVIEISMRMAIWFSQLT